MYFIKRTLKKQDVTVFNKQSHIVAAVMISLSDVFNGDRHC